MKITVKFFASHREFAGTGEIELELEEQSTISSLLEKLFEQYPGMKKLEEETIVSLNKNYAEPKDILKDGDEVAVFPPVSGG